MCTVTYRVLNSGLNTTQFGAIYPYTSSQASSVDSPVNAVPCKVSGSLVFCFHLMVKIYQEEKNFSELELALIIEECFNSQKHMSTTICQRFLPRQ